MTKIRRTWEENDDFKYSTMGDAEKVRKKHSTVLCVRGRRKKFKGRRKGYCRGNIRLMRRKGKDCEFATNERYKKMTR